MGQIESINGTNRIYNNIIMGQIESIIMGQIESII